MHGRRWCLIRVSGRRLGLTNRPAGSGGYAEATSQRVSISADELGQYRIRGAINDRYVDFLIDTGASVVAMSSAMQSLSGIDYSRGERGSVQTAQGNCGVLLHDPGSGHRGRNHRPQRAGRHHLRALPLDILLGMSFLKQVSMQESGGVMTLVQN